MDNTLIIHIYINIFYQCVIYVLSMYYICIICGWDMDERWTITGGGVLNWKGLRLKKKRNRTAQNGENYEQGQRKMTRIIFYKNKILFSNYKEKKHFWCKIILRWYNQSWIGTDNLIIKKVETVMFVMHIVWFVINTMYIMLIQYALIICIAQLHMC